MTPIAITTTDVNCIEKAKAISLKIDLPFFYWNDLSSAITFVLIVSHESIHLQKLGSKTLPLSVDFSTAKFNKRRLHATFRSELLAKAIGVKPKDHPVIIDATAGLGRDSFILASLGFDVIMLEKSPIVHLLLENGLERARNDPALEEIISRMTLIHTDAIPYLESLKKINKRPDVIYLDPMFPERKKSASVKKEMIFLQELLVKDENISDLFHIAIACATSRVVIKRPLHAATITERKPSYQLAGKSSRFDIYII